MLSDFPTQIVDEVAHRPWPMPDRPWLMTQSWHDLLFAHWPVDVRALRERVPPGFELDLYEGRAWLGVVPFDMTNVAPRFVPAVPGLSAFPELNVRTYVHVGDKPGVYFFSLDAESSVAVALARAMLKLPYYVASMDVSRQDAWVDYWSERHADDAAAPAEFEGKYRPIGPVQRAMAGSLEYFLTERYCLYNVDDQLNAYRLEIHHPPWQLQVAEAEIAVNTMADAAGIRLPSMAPLLHFSKRQDTVAWAPERL
ncbi:MAG TPA: DUF2071 domain-containing protein [Vicinamibacterales bacterium]